MVDSLVGQTVCSQCVILIPANGCGGPTNTDWRRRRTQRRHHSWPFSIFAGPRNIASRTFTHHPDRPTCPPSLRYEAKCRSKSDLW